MYIIYIYCCYILYCIMYCLCLKTNSATLKSKMNREQIFNKIQNDGHSEKGY